MSRVLAPRPGRAPGEGDDDQRSACETADGGLSDSLPVDFARSAQMGATHVIVSDCRFSPSSVPVAGKSLIYIRPDLRWSSALRGPRTALTMAVSRGEAAVTREIIDQIRSWMPRRRRDRVTWIDA